VIPPHPDGRSRRAAVDLCEFGVVEDALDTAGALNIVAGRLAALRVTAQPGRIRSRDFR
jgi:hypothetical protein